MNYDNNALNAAKSYGVTGGVIGIPNAIPVEQPLPAVQRRLADVQERLDRAIFHAQQAVTHVIGPRLEGVAGQSGEAGKIAPPPGIMLTIDRIEAAMSRLEATLRELC